MSLARLKTDQTAVSGIAPGRSETPAGNELHPFQDPRRIFGEAFVDLILPSLTACIVVIDGGGQILLVCNGGLSGGRADQISARNGDPWHLVWSATSAQEAGLALQAAVAGGIGRFEGCTVPQGGQPVWWDVVLRRVGAGGIAQGRVLAVCRNITAQRKAQAEARDKAALLEMTLEHMAQGLMLIDEQGRLRLCNRRAVELLDLPPELVAGEPHFDDLRRYQVERGEFDSLDPATLAAITAHDFGRRPIRYERQRPCGRRIEVRSIPLPTGGSVCTFTDISAWRLAEEEYEASEARYKALVEASSTMVWHADAAGMGTRTVSSGAFEGYSSEMFLGEDWLDLVHPADRAAALCAWRKAIAQCEPFESVERKRASDGSFRWVHVRAAPIRNAAGAVVEWIGATTDIHDRKMAEEALRDNEERLRLAIEATGLGTWDYDIRSGSRQWSDEMRAILGLARDAEIGREAFLARVHPDDRDAVERHFYVSFAQATAGRYDTMFRICRQSDGEMRWIATSGRVFFGDRGEPIRTVGTVQDVTERKLSEERLWRAANHDALTGLPNRAFLQSRLNDAARGAAHPVILLLIDIDDFKEINDMVGHDAGDEVLRVAARRLNALVGSEGVVARLGGDEFAAVLAQGHDLASASRLAQKILGELRKPFQYKDATLGFRASIGLAASPDHGQIADLMKNADIALYSAKANGRACVALYSPQMREAIERRVRTAADIREAIQADAIIPYYQPKICLQSGRVTGFEALARWRHPERGLLTPDAFASAFDDPELAVAIGEAMLLHVSRDLRGWLDQGVDCGRIAINLSTPEFSRPDLADTILARLASLEIPTRHFEVEVTENVFLGKGACGVEAILQQFHAEGVTVALDDFGTGYASLTHLKQFPVDEIKIDRSFVRDLQKDPEDAAIVAAVIGLGRSLGKRVIAEGVESGWQVEHLRASGCDRAQGYFYSRPMPASQVAAYLDGCRPARGR